eukprot:15768892-Heterocapsa_arctica.AAC.1
MAVPPTVAKTEPTASFSSGVSLHPLSSAMVKMRSTNMSDMMLRLAICVQGGPRKSSEKKR